MIIIYVAFACLAVLLGWLTYTTPAHRMVKAVAIVGLIILGLGLEAHYKRSLGKPIPDYPQGEFLYIAHEVQGDSIMLWAWTEGRGNRLYVIPFNQDTAEALEEAKDADGDQGGEFRADEGGEQNDFEPSLIIDDWFGEYTGETKGE